VTAIDDDLYIEANQTGSGTNYPFILSTTNSNPTAFPTPSFRGSPGSGNLSGGVNAQTVSQPVQVYSYTVLSGGYDGVGNLMHYTDSVTGTWDMVDSSGSGSGYDTLNRLSRATQTPVSGSAQSYCWSYDAFGNRTAQAISNQPFSNGAGTNCQAASGAALLASTQVSYSSANNNRLNVTPNAPNGVSHDASGNVTDDGLNEYLYDGDGRICAVANYRIPFMTIMTGYLYNAEGIRVAKGTITAWSCDPAVNGFDTTNDYILGLGGEQVTEMGVGGASSGSTTSGLVWQHTNVWAGGKLLATYDGDGTATGGGLYFYFNDPLGTRRVQTDSAGNVEQKCSSLPFGDGETCGTTPTEHLFTGKERDSESGNDYFGARYYASTMGRFLSPDWSAKIEPVPYAKLADPQSLNLYSYVRNNPLSNVDIDGHDCSGKDMSPCVRNTQISQTVNFYNSKGDVVSSVNVTTNLTVTSDAQTGAVTSVSASATATNVSGAKFSASQLSTIGSTVGAIQQAGASMALGSNPQQLMTAIVAKESTLGLAAPTNPLQLSGSSGFKPHAGDTAYNIQGALNVLQERGRRSNYDPATTYDRYNGVSDPVQRATNVRNFMNIYNGMSQSSWSYDLPPLPTAPVPAGLQ
jgi:RHS repeat-associated protein